MDHLDGTGQERRHLTSTDAGHKHGFFPRNSDVPPEVALFPPARPSDHINILVGGPRPPIDHINILESVPRPPIEHINILEGGPRPPIEHTNILEGGPRPPIEHINILEGGPRPPIEHINILERGPRPPIDHINILEVGPRPPIDHINILEGGPRDHKITRMTSAPLKQRQPLHQLNENPLTSNDAIIKSQSLSLDCGGPTAPRTASPSRRRGKNRSIKSSVIGQPQKKPMRGRLKPKHDQVILQNYEFLKFEIDARHITGHMVSNFAISLDDKEEINAKATQSGRTECFLDRLLVSGPGQAFDTFMDALRRKNYATAHRKLRQDLQKLGEP